VQARAGIGGMRAEDMFRPAMPAGVQRFLAAQQVAVLATIDTDGRVWASMRSGPPGFLLALDERTVVIGGYGHPDDPLLANLTAPSAMGMLVIHLATRHRMRLNGTASMRPDGHIVLTTEQVYGNCPQYIQAQTVVGDHAPVYASARTTTHLEARQHGWLTAADTCFLATAHPQAGADASHRGGKPGFMRLEGERQLLFPDYPGNNMFNSLGNITAYPRAGLLVPDFRTGAALQISGPARILWDNQRIREFPGAQRLVEFDIERVVELPQATLLRFTFDSYSPVLP
jgi:predicted pyridoxine 5'-phosphate oxidase superfamily flavin-nucleotide-binding protein